MYRRISDRASNASFSLRSLSGSERAASNKESRKLTSSEKVFSYSRESPTSSNYQAYKIIRINSKLITFQLTNETNKQSSIFILSTFFLIHCTVRIYLNWLIWVYLLRRTYGNNLWHVDKLLLAYFHKISWICVCLILRLHKLILSE